MEWYIAQKFIPASEKRTLSVELTILIGLDVVGLAVFGLTVGHTVGFMDER